MRHLLAPSLLIVAALLVLALPARSEGVATCPDHAAVERLLHGQYGEAVVWQGLTSVGARSVLTELWVNPSTRSWTITQMTPDGRTCIAEDGTAYEEEDYVKPVEGAPA